MIRFAIVIALASWSSTARAQPAGAQAEVLFRQGRELMAAGKLAEACSAFEASQKLEPAITTSINLAGCRERLGQLATAWGLFLEAERQTRPATSDATRQLHTVGKTRAQKLERRVSRLAINVPEGSQRDGLEIRRGSDPVDPVMWNRALPIDGGTYTISARAAGAEPWSEEVTVDTESDSKTVEIPVLRSVPTAEPDRPHHRRSKLAPLAVGAGALALVGGGLGFWLWGNSTYRDAKAEMTDQARRDALYDSANTKRYVAEALGVAGIACAGLAVWLYVRHGDERPTTTGSHLVVSPVGIALEGAF